MNAEELKKRTKQFGLRVIRLVESLSNTQVARVIGNQLIKSGISVGANYRSACRGRSKAEFIAKVRISFEEADESRYWMEMPVESELVPRTPLTDLMKEADELIANSNASVKTARKNLAGNKLDDKSTIQLLKFTGYMANGY